MKTVGLFPELKHTSIYVVRQLAYSTELLVCINEAYKQYKQEEEIKLSQLNSTLLKLSLFFSVLCSLCVSLCNSTHTTSLHGTHTYTYKGGR